MITFFMGHARFALESLAVTPVVSSFSFLFRCMGLSYQEAGIALIGNRNEHYEELKKFSLFLGLGASAALGAIAFTPLAGIWYARAAGLSAGLVAFALAPTCIHALLPFLEVQVSFQRSVLVNAGRTTPVTLATVTEVAVIVCALVLTVNLLDMVGATAAAISLLAGRLAGNLYLIPYKRKALRSTSLSDRR
jgi:O-antigen/teichoic acid export membrane protein